MHNDHIYLDIEISDKATQIIYNLPSESTRVIPVTYSSNLHVYGAYYFKSAVLIYLINRFPWRPINAQTLQT